MTDKKKKPVESALKKDLDAAINKAAVETLHDAQAEVVDQLATTIVADTITTKATEKLTEGKKKLPAVAQKVLDEAKKKIADLEIDDSSFDDRKGFGFKGKSPADQLKTEAPGIELSKIWSDDVPVDQRIGAVVTIGDVSLMPIGEPVKGITFGRGFSATDLELTDVSWRVRSAMNQLPHDVEFYHYVYRLGDKIVSLYLTEDCVFTITDRYYNGYGYGPQARALIVGIDSTFKDVTVSRASLVIKYDLENTHLCGANLRSIDPNRKPEIWTYENRRPRTDSFCHNNWSEDRRYTVKRATINDTDVINSDLEYGCYIDSNINRCILKSGTKAIGVNKSRINTLEIEATKSIQLTNSTLSGRITCAGGTIIEGLIADDLFINDAPVGVEITSQFGWVNVNWLNNTEIRFLTAEDDKLLIQLPYQYCKEPGKPWITLPVDWEQFELTKNSGGRFASDFPYAPVRLTSYFRFHRNGKKLERPDMVQRAFIEYLEQSIDSRLRVLALIRAVAVNEPTLVPKRPDYNDIPF